MSESSSNQHQLLQFLKQDKLVYCSPLLYQCSSILIFILVSLCDSPFDHCPCGFAIKQLLPMATNRWLRPEVSFILHFFLYLFFKFSEISKLDRCKMNMCKYRYIHCLQPQVLPSESVDFSWFVICVSILKSGSPCFSVSLLKYPFFCYNSISQYDLLVYFYIGFGQFLRWKYEHMLLFWSIPFKQVFSPLLVTLWIPWILFFPLPAKG